MHYRVILAPEALADSRALKASVRATVRDAVNRHLVHQPTQVSRSRIKRLRGIRRPQYRLRVGYVRIFYDVLGDSVEVLAIIDKSAATAWLQETGEEDV
jgi:mRNA-degrading endonuclease RelE of RelBE toxin-antitoxin system